MTDHIEKLTNHISVQFKYILFFSLLFTLMSIAANQFSRVYFVYFDKTKYYEILNPVTVERKQVTLCGYVDAYINRRVLVPIQGTSVKQLTLIRESDKKSQRMQSYTTDIQANTTNGVYEVMITHWKLPCGDIPFGTYYFEGTVIYHINDIQKSTRFRTENFEIIATPSAIIKK